MGLFWGPRYEFALLMGLLGPFLLALWLGLRARERGRSLGLAVRSAAAGVALLLVGAFVGGLVEGNCEPLLGYSLLLGGPGVGLLSAGLVVSYLLEALPEFLRKRRGVRVMAALLVPLTALGLGLYELYRGPAVFAYSEFVGYFAGPLYDLVDYRLETLASYRAGSLLLICALSSPAFFQETPARRGLFRVLLLGYLAWRSLGPELGHDVTERELGQELSGSMSSKNCAVRFNPHLTSRKNAELVLKQCEFDARGVSEYFETTLSKPVRVSLFSTLEEKGRWTGAGRTYVAKPWRHEVHLHEAGFPHPTLRHEIAHVVAAEFGRGPFKVAGSLGGWFPDPGRIEGFAVAAAPALESDGTLYEWAAVQAKLGKLPPLERLFQFGFYGAAAVSAYGASGAFVSYIKDTYGATTLRRWYAGTSLETLTGLGLSSLEGRFLLHLQATPVPEFVERSARERFSAIAVVERHCPHAVDRALGEARALCELDPEQAQRRISRAVALDPNEADSNLWLSSCYLHADKQEHAAELLEGYRHGPPWSLRDKSLRIADLAFFRGDVERAKAAYAELLPSAKNSDEARALELRLWALSDQADEVSREAVRVGALGVLSDFERLGQLSSLGAGDGFVAPYLLGRAFLQYQARRSGTDLLALAAERDPPHPSLLAEALRLALVGACALGDEALAARSAERLSLVPLTSNEQAELAYLRGLCRAGKGP